MAASLALTQNALKSVTKKASENFEAKTPLI